MLGCPLNGNSVLSLPKRELLPPQRMTQVFIEISPAFIDLYRGEILNLKVKFTKSTGISVFLHIFSFAKGVVCDELIKARRLKLG